MPKTATPRKPETLERRLAETRNTSRNRNLAGLLGLQDRNPIRDMLSAANDVTGRGMIAGFLGLPGDLGGMAENGIRYALGMPQVTPYGGSEHIGQQMEKAGLVTAKRRPVAETLASLISPSAAATAVFKAPAAARAGVRLLDNLADSRGMGRGLANSQVGAIDVGPQAKALRVAQQNAAKPDGLQRLLSGEDNVAMNPEYEKKVMDKMSYLFRNTDRSRYNNIYDEYQAELDSNGTIGGKPYGMDMDGLDRDEYGDLTDLGMQQYIDITSSAIESLAKKEAGIIQGFDDIDHMSDAYTAREAVAEYLRQANIGFITPRSGGSHYIEVRPQGWQDMVDEYPTLKLRFSDHANESNKYKEADYNWVAKRIMGGEDTSYARIRDMIDAAHKFANKP